MYLCLYLLGDPAQEYKNGAVAVAETGFVSKRYPFFIEVNGTHGSILLSDMLEGALWLSYEKGSRCISAEELIPSTPLPTS